MSNSLPKLNVNPGNHKQLVLFLSFFGLGLIFLSIVYFPAISVNPFFWHEDARFFEDRSGGLLKNLGDFELMLGRYVISLLHYLFGILPIHKISDLIFVRLAFIPLIALGLALLASWFYWRLGFSKKVAFFLSGAIFTLPAISIMIIGVVHSHVIVTVLLAFLSGFLIERACGPNCSMRQILSIRGILAFFALIVMFCGYQIASMFICVFPMGLALFTDLKNWKKIWPKIKLYYVFIVLAAVSYYALHKFLMIPLMLSIAKGRLVAPENCGYAVELAFKISKFYDLIYRLTPQNINLWNIYPNNMLTFSLYLLIWAGIILSMLRLYRYHMANGSKRMIISYVLQKTFIICLLLITVNAVQLVAPGLTPNYYHGNIGYPTCLLLLIVWAIRAIARTFSQKAAERMLVLSAGCMMILGGFLGQKDSLNCARTHNLELLFFKSRIKSHYATYGYLNCVHVIKPEVNAPYNASASYLNLPQVADFNGMAWQEEFYIFLWDALKEFFPEKVSIRVWDGRSNFSAAPEDCVIITSSRFGEPYITCQDALIINMNDLMPVPKKGLPVSFYTTTAPGSHTRNRTPVVMRNHTVLLASIPTVTSSSNMNSDPHLGPDGLLYGDTIWHAQTPPKYPEWVEITYERPMTVTKLRMKPQPNNSPGDDMHKRAPKNFIFQASNDKNGWVDLLTVKDNLHKDGNDWHEWNINNDKKYRYYRLYITKGGNPDLLTIHRLELELKELMP